MKDDALKLFIAFCKHNLDIGLVHIKACKEVFLFSDDFDVSSVTKEQKTYIANILRKWADKIEE